jgi:hypothetical protein
MIRGVLARDDWLAGKEQKVPGFGLSFVPD